MKVKQNIGIVNALIRITCGFTFLSWATAKMVKRPWKDSYLLIAFLSAMKIAEGIVRFCPVTALYEEVKRRSRTIAITVTENKLMLKRLCLIIQHDLPFIK
jgi:hypothetical protein